MKDIQAQRVKKALTQIIKDVLHNDNDFRSCFRVYQAKVTAAPSTLTGRCSVRLTSQNKDITIPFSSACADCSVGDMVLVATISNSFRNAVVWQKYDFQ